VAILIADPDFVDNRIQYMPPLNPFGRKLDTAVRKPFSIIAILLFARSSSD
jgi:hypothetical protein